MLKKEYLRLNFFTSIDLATASLHTILNYTYNCRHARTQTDLLLWAVKILVLQFLLQERNVVLISSEAESDLHCSKDTGKKRKKKKKGKKIGS